MRLADVTTHTLPGYQQKYLRSKAHHFKPAFRISQINDNIIIMTKQFLEREELIKIRLERPEDRELCAVELAEKTDSYLCGILGNVIILYRRNPKNPKIQLPSRESSEQTQK